MRRLLACIVGFVALITTSCDVPLLTDAPEQGIADSVNCSGSLTPVKGMQVAGKQRWSQGVVVLFSGLCPGSDPKASMQRVFGYQVVKRHQGQWQANGSGSYQIEDRQKISEKLVSYGVSKSLEFLGNSWQDGKGVGLASPAENRYAILYGQILSPKVTSVEVTFDNGQVLRNTGANGVFAMIAPGATAVCELRVLGADNQILQQRELVLPKPLVANQHSHQCLSASYQI